MPDNTRKKLHVISIFSIDKASGHSVYDDLFYFSLLKKAGRSFKFFAPPYSIVQLAKSHILTTDSVSPISVEDRGVITSIKAILSMPVSRDSTVVFLGYSEKFVFLFYLVNLLKKYELVLVATNNFSVGRVAKYEMRLRVFFLLIGRCLKRIVVHTEKEKAMCFRLGANLGRKAVVKKHHLMIPRDHSGYSLSSGKRVVLFPGPEKYDKPLQPMIDLVKADVDQVFEYQFLNVDSDVVNAKYELPASDNVKFINKWLSKQEYFQQFCNSSFVMMSHDRSFEGKLSGNLCDCIALGVPFISLDIEPIKTYMKQYGAIGCVYDFSDPGWARSFLQEFRQERYEEFRLNLQKLSLDHQLSLVEDDNINALCN